MGEVMLKCKRLEMTFNIYGVIQISF